MSNANEKISKRIDIFSFAKRKSLTNEGLQHPNRLFWDCFSAKMQIFIGARFTAAENIEKSITAKIQSSQGLRTFVQLF